MAVRFSKGFPALRRLFPGTGGWQGPSSISDSVQFVESIYRPSVAQDIHFNSDVQTVATGGADASLDHPEPSAGYFHYPLLWRVHYNGAVNIVCWPTMVATASALDPWGRYLATSQVLCSVETVNNDFINVPVFPYMRGQSLRARWPTPAAATAVTSMLIFLEMPAELADLSMWRSVFGNFAFNNPMP